MVPMVVYPVMHEMLYVGVCFLADADGMPHKHRACVRMDTERDYELWRTQPPSPGAACNRPQQQRLAEVGAALAGNFAKGWHVRVEVDDFQVQPDGSLAVRGERVVGEPVDGVVAARFVSNSYDAQDAAMTYARPLLDAWDATRQTGQ